MVILTKPTYLIVRSTNHVGLSQNTSIWPADLVFSSVGLSSCITTWSTTTWSSASLLSSLSQFSSSYSYVFCFLFLLTNLTIYQQLAMLCSLYIYPPRICNHRRKTHFTAHLSTLLLCLHLRPLLVFTGQNDAPGRPLPNTGQNRMFQGFPFWTG